MNSSKIREGFLIAYGFALGLLATYLMIAEIGHIWFKAMLYIFGLWSLLSGIRNYPKEGEKSR